MKQIDIFQPQQNVSCDKYLEAQINSSPVEMNENY